MPIALRCVLIAALLPYVCIQIARFTGPRRDNRQPRQWAADLTDVAQRANGAQQNHFEVFPFFAVAVLVAILGGSRQRAGGGVHRRAGALHGLLPGELGDGALAGVNGGPRPHHRAVRAAGLRALTQPVPGTKTAP
ncbi:DNAase [Ralstonia solanacearum]|nr:DNAase [Ralstonia solanacearum]